MAYTAIYETADLQDMIMDLLGTVFVVLIANIGLIIFLVVMGIVIYHFRGIFSSLLGFTRIGGR